MNQSAELLAEQSILIDAAAGAAVVTIAESNLGEFLAGIIGNRLLEIAHHNEGRLVIRLDLVNSFGSAWINQLLKLSDHCEGLGGKLVLTGIAPDAMQMLSSTGLAKRLCFAEDVKLAVDRVVALSQEENSVAEAFAWLLGRSKRRAA